MISTACNRTAKQEATDKSLIAKDKQQFYEEVIAGLKMSPKRLPSKYFYDAVGDKLFQDIMNSEDYYLTRCEMDIFTNQTQKLADAILENNEPFDLIELGAGDCTKSIHLFRALIKRGATFTYIPIDISENVIHNLETELPGQAPGIKVQGMNGEYFKMLGELHGKSERRKVILCLGGNIANMTIEDSHAFCKNIRKHLSVNDLAIIGFDLKKNPAIIRRAYFDREGITSKFNLNLLHRMNRELKTDFDTDCFEHYCSYDPETGSCRSYLVCLDDMEVHFCNETISFKKDECIWMEISQKHTLEQVDQMALANGFKPFTHLMDSKSWFVDAVWIAG